MVQRDLLAFAVHQHQTKMTTAKTRTKLKEHERAELKLFSNFFHSLSRMTSEEHFSRVEVEWERKWKN